MLYLRNRSRSSSSDMLWKSMLRPKRPGSRSDRFQRYRSVVLLACIPALLITAVISLVPRHSPLHLNDRNTLVEVHHHGAPSTPLRYCVVFDAGSTGSRVHVFVFQKEEGGGGGGGGGGLKLLKDTFEQLKPGLSAFPDDPAAAAASLKPLLEVALKTVPEEVQSSTPIMLKATAGLRLLPGNKAQRILEAVNKMLKDTKFNLANDGVAILDGQDEGGFAWLTLNYLLGKLKGPAEGTVGAIDLGGGSVQEAFAVSPDGVKSAPKGYVMDLKAEGRVFHVYVHSYLGYGLMAGRAKLAGAVAAVGSGEPGCFPGGYSGLYKYGGQEIKVVSSKDAGASFGSCSSLATAAINASKACGAPQTQCSFNGAWRGQDVPTSASRSYYVSSYFWDRATDVGIITDSAARTWPATAADFAVKAQAVCNMQDVPSLLDKFGKSVKETELPYLCLDLTYAHVLLTKGFRLHERQSLTLVKQVQYNGEWIEAAWPLGAALNALAS